ncbi:MAG: DinB family protein [Marivirga sp.]|nr:DinB family protein [Marivirga sp.]
MAINDKPEVWLRGPIDGISSFLQPVAHALLQAQEEVNEAILDFPETLLWEKPAGVASVGFHLQHLAGVLDRLFTYARGESLNGEQLFALQSEEQPPVKPCSVQLLINRFDKQVDTAIKQLRETSDERLLEPMDVGRKKLPSTVLGLLFHAAEHTQRHTGQLLVTAKILSSGSID